MKINANQVEINKTIKTLKGFNGNSMTSNKTIEYIRKSIEILQKSCKIIINSMEILLK